jgi:nucleoside-diphosphate-sugar epimerase
MTDGVRARVLVTGANGFVGSALVRELLRRGVPVNAAVRSGVESDPRANVVRVGDLGTGTDWGRALAGCDAVVHCAARVHVMADDATDPLAAYRHANTEGTVALANQAAAAGVRRFVFLSSIKVNGEATRPGAAFTERAAPAPRDPYGISKLEAERRLAEMARSNGMELVILRIPLVYGPGVKANFRDMVRWLERGVPLPFGAITRNRRSLLALDNLVDLILLSLVHPAAPGQVFLASDGEDLSTADLLRRTAAALGVGARLIPVPTAILAAGAALLGRRDLWQRLGGSLQVDSSHARRLLGWAPPLAVDEGLRRVVAPLKREASR